MSISKKYQGVTSNNGTFKTQISRRGKIFYLGNYPTDLKAAQMYDRALILTAAYTSGRTARPNFDGSERPNDEIWTEWEKEMMTWLRTYHPNDEKRHAETIRGEEFLPDTVLRNCMDMVDRTKSFVDILFAHLDDVAQSLKASATQMAEMKVMLDWQRGRLQAAEDRVRMLEGMPIKPHEFVFKKVVVPDKPKAPAPQPVEVSASLPPPAVEVPAVLPQEVPAPAPLVTPDKIAVAFPPLPKPAPQVSCVSPLGSGEAETGED